MKIEDARKLKANDKVFQIRKGVTTHPPQLREYVVADVEETIVYASEVFGRGQFLLVVYNPTYYADLLTDAPNTGLNLLGKGITLASTMQLSIRSLERDELSARKKYQKACEQWQLTKR